MEEPAAFIPPAPERAVRPVRMPRLDELPIPAQNQILQRDGSFPIADHPEKKRATLLQRLASVGLGRRDEEQEQHAREPAMNQQAEPPADYRRQPREQQRGARGQLDSHGRQQPARAVEDELEIPAFLRRQAN